MKPDLQAKFLQHLHQKKADQGFTLIELLVVIIIIGILSAIALPSFLNQANKARESEAKQYVGSMNRSQQAHFLEKNEFTSEMSRLGLGISTNTENYSYDIVKGNPNDLKKGVVNISSPKNSDNLRAYVGAVDLAEAEGGSSTTVAILCQSSTPEAGVAGAVSIDAGTNQNQPTCVSNFEPIK